MAYDEDLAERVRDLIGGRPDLTERKMFGGLGFMLGGHMAVAAGGQQGLLVRIDPDRSTALRRRAGAHLMEMGGRSLKGWLHIDAEHLRTTRQLRSWVAIGVAYVDALPPKS